MGTPKLSRRFHGLEAESVQIDKDLSGFCESFSQSIKQRVDELERAERQLGVLRATLLVNFGAKGAAGIKAGVSVKNAENVATLDLLLSVLEQLCDKIEKLKPVEVASTGKPRRIDREGRDVTDLPGLWSETDEIANR